MSQSLDNQLVTEAKMSPSVFDDAIEIGESEKVLVGFEFEFYMSHTAFLPPEFGPNDDVISIYLKNTSIHPFSYTYQVATKVDSFSKIFKLKPGASSKYENFSDGVKDIIDNVIEKCRVLFERMSEESRIGINHAFKNKVGYYSNPDYMPKTAYKRQVLKFLYYIVSPYATTRNYARGSAPRETQHLKYYFLKGASTKEFKIPASSNDKRLVAQIYRNLKTLKLNELITNIVGADIDTITDNWSNYFEYEQAPARSFFGPSLTDYLERQRLGGSNPRPKFNTAVSELSEKYLGVKPIIFHSYHQRRKTLSDWYLEPDGSLVDPKSSKDQSGELVSPPLSPSKAIEALKNFYSMSLEGKFYTNKSTGLHMNVSIPKKIDPLKLAIFSGDQYMLELFGRENSHYALSVMKKLTSRAAKGTLGSDELDRRRKTNVFDTKIMFAALSKLARSVMDDHISSINVKKNYVSFRSPGGDYLSDYQKIANAVGRFIKLMLIASDPNAYVEEYKTKVAKLIELSKSARSTTSEYNKITFFRDLLQKIRSSKTIVLFKYTCYSKTSGANKLSEVIPTSTIGTTAHYSGLYISSPKTATPEEKENLLNIAKTLPSNGVLNSRMPTNLDRTLAAINKSNNIYITYVWASNNVSYKKLKDRTNILLKLNHGYDYYGWGTGESVVVPTDSPIVAEFINSITQSIKLSLQARKRYAGKNKVTPLPLPESDESVEELSERKNNQSIYYFAYGMLTDPGHMKGLNAKLIGRARLNNYKFELLKHANIIEQPNSSLDGALWKIDQNTLDFLDQIEGYPYYYDRVKVNVLVNNTQVSAWAYMMTDESRQNSQYIPPSNQYIDSIVRGYRSARINLAQLIQAIKEFNDKIDNETI